MAHECRVCSLVDGKTTFDCARHWKWNHRVVIVEKKEWTFNYTLNRMMDGTFEDKIQKLIASNKRNRRQSNLIHMVLLACTVDEAAGGWSSFRNTEFVTICQLVDMWCECLDSLTTVALKREYINGVFVTHFGSMVDFGNNKEEVNMESSDYVVAQAFASGCSSLLHGIKGRLYGAARKVGSFVYDNCTFGGIIGQLRQMFETVMGSYLHKVLEACTWIHKIWVAIERWCDELMKTHLKWVACLGEAVYWAVGLAGVTCMIALLEKFLVACGLLAAPIGLATNFTLLVAGIVGASFLVNKGLSKVEELNTLLVGMTTQFLQRLSPCLFNMAVDDIEREKRRTRAQFSPLQMLHALADSIGHWNAKSFVEYGRVAASFTQIKNGLLSIRDMAKFVMDGLWKITKWALDLDSYILRDTSLMLGEDIKGWLEECDACVEYEMAFHSNTREVMDRMSVLQNKGKSIRNALATGGTRVSPQMFNLVNKATEKLDMLIRASTVQGVGRPRKMPFVVFITGASRTGKSMLAQKIANEWVASQQMGSDQVYARNSLDPFWTGYKRQAVVTYDDFGAVRKEGMISDEAELIPLVSCNPVGLHMAALEEKGTYFDSKMIVISSNFVAASPHSNVHDQAAYENRRHVVIRVTTDGKPYNAAEPTGNHIYTLLSSRADFEPMIVDDAVVSFTCFEDLSAYLWDQQESHELAQEKELASIMLNPIAFKNTVKSVFELSVGFLGYTPMEMQSYVVAQGPQWMHFLTHRGVMYLWDGEKIEKHTTGVSKKAMDEAEKLTFEFSLRYLNMLKHIPMLNPLAIHYACDLVKKGLVDSSFKPLRAEVGSPDYFLTSLLNDAPEWQLILLRVLHENTQCEGKGWFVGLYDQVCGQLVTMYTKEFKDWPMSLKIVLGLGLIAVAGTAIWSAFSFLGTCGTGAKFVTAVPAVLCAQSVAPNRQEVTEYKFKNVPVRARHWSKGQACFGDSQFWMMEKCLATIKFAGFEFQAVMLPGRRFLAVRHLMVKMKSKCMVTIHLGNDRKYTHAWNPNNLREIEGSELMMYESPMLEPVTESLWDRIVFDPEKELPGHFEAMLVSCKWNQESNCYLSEYVNVDASVTCRSMTVTCGESYKRYVPKRLIYEASTVDNDCGSLLLVLKGDKWVLAGIHVAADDRHGSACLIPNFPKSMVGQCSAQYFDSFDQEKVFGPNLTQCATVRKEVYIAVPTKTSLSETPEAWHLGKPCDKVPSILSNQDPRLKGTVNQGYDPFSAGMLKYTKEAGPFDEILLEEVTNDMLESWFDVAENFSFAEATTEEAINGVEGLEYFDSLVMGTSEGFPHILDRGPNEKGKRRYVEGECGALKLVEGTTVQIAMAKLEEDCKVQVPEYVCIECPKDEKLPKRKVYEKPKTRTFSILPMEVNLVVRKKFLNFVRFIMKKRDVLPTQVGINPYGREWTRLAEQLQENGDNILCCDYSSFDGLCSKQVMSHIARIINKLSGGSEVLCKQRENLLMACCSRLGICKNVVYRVECGIPSGFPLTVILNSLLNEIFMRYHYKVIMRKEGFHFHANSFDKFVKLKVFGDDNNSSVEDSIKEVFTGTKLKKEMENNGIVITDGKNKMSTELNFRRLGDCDFLKRTFVLGKDGLWNAPMEKESLWAQLHFVKEKDLGMQEAYIINAESVLRELYLHGRDECESFRRELLTLKWVKPSQIPTISQIEAFFFEQRNGLTKDYSLSVDVMLNPHLLGSLTPGTVCNREEELVPGVVVCTTKAYVRRDNDYVVRLGLFGKIDQKDGTVVSWPVGIGRGALPTSEWMRANFLRTNANLKQKIRTAEIEGKRLVFLCPNGLLIAYIFAVFYLASTSKINQATSNVLLTAAMEKVSTLGYLVGEFPEFF